MPSESRVLLGSLCQPPPLGLWISPDRSASTDQLVRRVERLEEELEKNWEDITSQPTEGQVVAVRHGPGVARGQVQGVSDGLITLFLPDWGVWVQKKRSSLSHMPDGLKMPRSLAIKLVLSSVIEDKQLVELVGDLTSEARWGRLKDVKPGPGGKFVTGILFLELDSARCAQLLAKWGDMLAGQDLTNLGLNSLVETWQTNIAGLRRKVIENKGDTSGARVKMPVVQTFGATDIRERQKLETSRKHIAENVKAQNDTTNTSSSSLKQKQTSSVDDKIDVPRNLNLKAHNGTLMDLKTNSSSNSVKQPIINNALQKHTSSDVRTDLSRNTEGKIEGLETSNEDGRELDNAKSLDISSSSVSCGPGSNTSADVSALLAAGTGLGKVYTQPVPARVELEQGTGHTKFGERWGTGDTLSQLLVHKPGGGRSVRPCDQVVAMDWVGSLTSFLRQNQVNNSSRVQAVLWPVVSRLQSVVAVAGPACGKTLGWILPLVNNLSDTAQYSKLPPGQGPLSVVLCPGLRSASIATKLLRDVIVGARLNIRVVTACTGAGSVEPSDFINGMEVLVTTVPRLLELVDQRLTNLARCCHLVLEEADRLLPVWHQEVGNIVLLWQQSKVGQSEARPAQVMVLAERWNSPLEQFTKAFLSESTSPVLVFANLLEGCVYGGVSVLPAFFMAQEEKLTHLQSLVSHREVNQRLVICCQDETAAHHLSPLLGEEVTLLHPGMDASTLSEVFGRWSNNPLTPLVVTDTCLNSLTVGGADRGTVLVHWDVPADSKSDFGARFTFVKSLMKSIFKPGPAQPGEVHVLLEPEDAPSISFLVPFFKRCGADIPETLELFSSAVSQSKAKDSLFKEAPLCHLLVERGTCPDLMSVRCQHRHFMHPDLDSPKVQKTWKGVLTFFVLRVESPVRYWVRVQDDVFGGLYQRLVMGMARHFASPRARQSLGELKRGAVVAALCRDGVYRRAKVTSLVYQDKGQLQQLDRLEVFTVDEGGTEVVRPSEVSALPENLGLEVFPVAATSVVVSGLVPPDQDLDWGTHTSMFVSNHLTGGRVETEALCRGRVLLHLSNTVWLDRCQLMVHQPSLSRYVCQFETVQGLLEAGLATSNPSHMENLALLADNAGLDRPELDMESMRSDIVVSGPMLQKEDIVECTAFLPRGETVKVYMSECVSPSLFYLHRLRDVGSLYRLERDLTDWAEDEKYQDHKFRPVVGEVAIVRLEGEETFCRARVIESLGGRMLDDNSGRESAAPRVDEFYKVLCVDSGVQADVAASQMHSCPAQFLTRLPLQAVRCRLARVRPGDESEWSGLAADELFNLTRDPDTDEALTLDCTVLEVEDSYLVSLRAPGGLDVGQELVRIGLAELETEHDNVENEDTLENETGIFYSDEHEAEENEDSQQETDWDLPNGLPEDVVNYDRLYGAAKQRCEQFRRDMSDEEEVPSKTALPPQTKAVEVSTIQTPRSLESFIMPHEVPSFALVENVSCYKSGVPSLVWGQDRASLSLRVMSSSMTDLHPGQVHVKVRPNLLLLQLLEVELEGQTETLTLRQTPELQLHGAVLPSRSEVVVRPRVVDLRLVKQKRGLWPRLTCQKFGWIRRDSDMGEYTDSEQEEELGDRPDKGFLNQFLRGENGKGAHGKRYHQLTGEEILPESMWLPEASSDSEMEELEFLHERPVEYNPDIL